MNWIKWLLSLVQLVIDHYNSHCNKDSFTLAVTIQQLYLNLDATFRCSICISSLFTNIPQAETIQSFAGTLNNSEVTPPTILLKNSRRSQFIVVQSCLPQLLLLMNSVSFIPPRTNRLMVLPWVFHLVQHLPRYSLNTTTRHCFGESTNQSCISDTLMTSLKSSTRNLIVIVFFWQ